MNVGVAHSEGNPNTRVMNSRGIWLTYALGVGMLHVVLLSIPFFSVPVVWTLTNVIHNLVSPLVHCLCVYGALSLFCLGTIGPSCTVSDSHLDKEVRRRHDACRHLSFLSFFSFV